MKTRKIAVNSIAAMALGVTLLIALNAMAVNEKAKLNTADARFIQDEVAAGGALVQLGELGEKSAQRTEVKSFAEMLVTEHTKANAELTTLAARKGLELTSEPVAKYVDMQEKLARATEAEFDKEFLAMVIKEHEKGIKNFADASSNAQDSDVKEWTAKSLPGMQAHLAQAEKLNSGLATNDGSPSTKSSSTQPDNTARNVRDRDPSTLTPLDQGNSKADIDTTAQIRREIVDMKGLSINAQNVKIITNEGHVTLRGPVESAEEKRIIGEIVNRIATPEHTDNQIEVRSNSAAN